MTAFGISIISTAIFLLVYFLVHLWEETQTLRRLVRDTADAAAELAEVVGKDVGNTTTSIHLLQDDLRILTSRMDLADDQLGKWRFVRLGEANVLLQPEAGSVAEKLNLLQCQIESLAKALEDQRVRNELGRQVRGLAKDTEAARKQWSKFNSEEIERLSEKLGPRVFSGRLDATKPNLCNGPKTKDGEPVKKEEKQ